MRPRLDGLAVLIVAVWVIIGLAVLSVGADIDEDAQLVCRGQDLPGQPAGTPSTWRISLSH
jgi:hypothetical protein